MEVCSQCHVCGSKAHAILMVKMVWSENCSGVQLNGARFYAAGSNGYYLGLISNGVQYGFTDAAISSYFSGQVSALLKLVSATFVTQMCLAVAHTWASMLKIRKRTSVSLVGQLP